MEQAGSNSTDGAILDSLDPALSTWWRETFESTDAFGHFTPPQRAAIPEIQADNHTLICSPTGSGKTLASFTAIIDSLIERTRAGTLPDSICCVYISPLKSLANDIHRNLTAPLEALPALDPELATPDGACPIRHTIRHGDTSRTERREMRNEPPHILNTTPETLAILLNAPAFREHLRTVEYVVVDEIHALANNKRGVHLSVSLERLEELSNHDLTRIGCSATIEPIETVASFLGGQSSPGGTGRPVSVVDERFDRDRTITVDCPTIDPFEDAPSTIQSRLYDRLESLILDHDTTAIFTNTRAGAERVLERLRERESFDESNTGCHHGSMSSGARETVEDDLKAGSLRVVTTSTSLELGVDMPTLDLVVQIGSPKSAAALLQRVGRSGHALGEAVTGRVIALDPVDLIEVAAIVERASANDIEPVTVPNAPLDVAAQHVFGMAINAVRPERDIGATLRRAYPYRNLTSESLEALMTYMDGSARDLTDYHVYPKIWRDSNDPPDGEHHYEDYPVGTPLVGKRGRLARPIYFQNVGTIPDSFSVRVHRLDTEAFVGELDEPFLDTLARGEVFLLGGDRYEYQYRRGSALYVKPTDAPPTVPTWFAERRPLPGDLAIETAGVLDRLSADVATSQSLRKTLPGGRYTQTARHVIAEFVEKQQAVAPNGNMPGRERLIIEELHRPDDGLRQYLVLTCRGRAFNEGLSRLLAATASEQVGRTPNRAVDDIGFVLVMPRNRPIPVESILRDIDPDAVRSRLREALADTDLLMRHFRITARRALLLIKHVGQTDRSAEELQFLAELLLNELHGNEGFAPLEETYRSLYEGPLALEAVEAVIDGIDAGEISIISQTVETPSPLGISLTTLSGTETVVTDTGLTPRQALYRDLDKQIDT